MAASIGVSALLQVTEGTGSNPEVTPGMNTQASGSTILIGVAGWDSNNPATVTDNKGNGTIGVLTAKSTYAGGSFSHLYYAKQNAAGGSGHTFTIPTAGYAAGEITAMPVEIIGGAGQDGSTVIQAVASASDGSPWTTVNITTSVANCVLVSYIWGEGNGTPHIMNPDANWTKLQNATAPTASEVQGAMAARVVGAAGTYSITWTNNNGFGNVETAVIVIIAIASSGPTITAQPTDQTAFVGGSVAFASSATGSGSLTWALQDNSSGSFADIQTGSGSPASVTIGPVTLAMNGRRYRYIWTDTVGSSTSSEATLFVRPQLPDTRKRKTRSRGIGAYWTAPTVGGEKFSARGWFSRDIVLPVSAGGGAAALQADLATVTTLTAGLTNQIRLAATPAAQCTITAALLTQIPLAAAPAALTTVTGALATQIRLAATPAAQVTVSAALTTGIPLAAAAQSVVTLTAALPTTAAALQAAVQGQTTVTAALSTQIPLASQAVGQATVTASLTTGIALAATAQGVCTVTAALAGGSAALAASVQSASSVTAALTTAIQLASSVQSATTITATLAGTAAPLQASAQAQTSVTANLSTQIPLQSAVSVVTTVTSPLSTAITLAASPAASCTVTAALTTAIRLQSAVQAAANVTAGLAGGAAALHASVQGQSIVTADLTIAKPLACAVIAQSQVSAALTTQIALQAITQAQTTAAAALTTGIRLQSAVSMVTTLTGMLSSGVFLMNNTEVWQVDPLRRNTQADPLNRSTAVDTRRRDWLVDEH